VTTSPNRRFTRLSHADPELAGVTITFLGAAPGTAPTPDNHGVLASVAATDPQRAARIEAGLTELIAQDDRMMTWLQADPANATLFTHDPVAAVHEALPGLPADIFDGWR
jgi:hypothetical protein